MIVPRIVFEQYEQSLKLVENAGLRVKDTLVAFCEQQGYLFEGRVKSLESVAEKVESGRYRSWFDIDDLYAASIIIPLPSDEPSVLGFLNDTFTRVRLTKRGQVKKPPDTFRFDSSRFIGRLRAPDGFDAGPEASIYKVQFEIQVKTVFEYAWSKTTHALAYKSQDVSWERLRLAAQLKASVELLDALVLRFDTAVQFVEKGSSFDLQDKKKIYLFFSEKAKAGSIPSEVCPKDWSRFVDNVYRICQFLEGVPPTGRGNARLTQIDKALQIILQELSSLNPLTFPRSISLFQFVLGTLIQSEEWKVIPESPGYFLPVTTELMTIFPKTQSLVQRISFGDKSSEPSGEPDASS